MEWLVALVFGVALGYATTNKKEEIKSVESPTEWQPKAHEQMLKFCGYECGASGKGLKSYSPISGQCTCLDK